jgi:hypothetical protein
MGRTEVWASYAAALSALGLSACSGPSGDDAGVPERSVGSAAQPLVGASVTLERPEVGMLHAPGWGAGCTATLMHQRFIVSAAHCVAYPVAHRNDRIQFTTQANELVDYIIDRAWILPPHLSLSADGAMHAKYDTQAALNADIYIGRLTRWVDSSVATPARIATRFPSDGSTVSIFGYGSFGPEACSSDSDDSKRARNFVWGPPLYPICGGDSGGPVFDAGLPSGNQLTVNGNDSGLGSLVHMRERLYEEMRKMLNWPSPPARWLIGSTRQAAVTATRTAASPAACEDECIKDASCRAWNLDGSSCALMATIGPWVPSATATSGIRPIVEPSRARGGELISTEPAISPHHCAALCGLNAECKSYSHNTSTSRCSLFKSQMAPSANSSAASGIRRPAEPSMSRSGTRMSESQEPSPQACETKCSQKFDCQSYTFSYVDNGTSGTCQLKYGAPAPQSAGVSFVSAMKRSIPLSETRIEGTVLRNWYTPAPRLGDVCRADCESDTSCVAYNIADPAFGVPLRCQLLSSVSREVGAFDTSASYRGLSFF